jgi:hypothetical protein
MLRPYFKFWVVVICQQIQQCKLGYFVEVSKLPQVTMTIISWQVNKQFSFNGTFGDDT